MLRQDLSLLVGLEVQTTLGKDESKDFKRPDSMNMSGTSTSTGVILASPACPADTVSTHAAMNYGCTRYGLVISKFEEFYNTSTT